MFLGQFYVQHSPFSALTLRRISVVKFSTDRHNRQFSTPCCGAPVCCEAAVAPNHRINFLFGLGRRCRGWPVVAGPVTDVLLKRRTQRLS
jgi:hypothetical protein